MTIHLERGDWQALTASWTALLREAQPPAGPFASPQFQSAWWDIFGADFELDIQAVRDDGELIGVLPLKRSDGCVSFIGDGDVCDYMDMLAAPGRSPEVAAAFLDHLEASNAARAELSGIPADSDTLACVALVARERGWNVQEEDEAVCPIVPLSSDWDSYLGGLKKKHRHEIRRKMRNLLDGGATVDSEVIESPQELIECLPSFLQLMTDSRGDKAHFLTEQMAAFFHTLVDRLAPQRLLRLYFLRVDGKRVAAVLTFLQEGTLLAYNSGYDPEYRSLSVGIASKIFMIRDAIDRGLSSVNFLRGDEEYKYQLGGQASSVKRLIISR